MCFSGSPRERAIRVRFDLEGGRASAGRLDTIARELLATARGAVGLRKAADLLGVPPVPSAPAFGAAAMPVEPRRKIRAARTLHANLLGLTQRPSDYFEVAAQRAMEIIAPALEVRG